MNKDRRNAINKALGLLQEAKDILETCREEEQEFYDNMPENMQNGEKGGKAQAASEALESAVSNLDEAISDCEGATE